MDEPVLMLNSTVPERIPADREDERTRNALTARVSLRHENFETGRRF